MIKKSITMGLIQSILDVLNLIIDSEINKELFDHHTLPYLTK